MRDEQRRPGICGEHPTQDGPGRGGARHIEAGEWFVKNQDLGLGSQRSGQCHPLCLTAGQFGGFTVGKPVSAHLGEPPLGTDAGARPVLVPTRTEHHVAEHAHMGEQQRILQQHPDPSVMGGHTNPRSGIGQCAVAHSHHCGIGRK